MIWHPVGSSDQETGQYEEEIDATPSNRNAAFENHIGPSKQTVRVIICGGIEVEVMHDNNKKDCSTPEPIQFRDSICKGTTGPLRATNLHFY
jgi:hypothetical protein